MDVQEELSLLLTTTRKTIKNVRKTSKISLRLMDELEDIERHLEYIIWLAKLNKLHD